MYLLCLIANTLNMATKKREKVPVSLWPTFNREDRFKNGNMKTENLHTYRFRFIKCSWKQNHCHFMAAILLLSRKNKCKKKTLKVTFCRKLCIHTYSNTLSSLTPRNKGNQQKLDCGIDGSALVLHLPLWNNKRVCPADSVLLGCIIFTRNTLH